MASMDGATATGPRRIRPLGTLLLAAVVALVALLLIAQNSTVVFPALASYRLVDERTIALTVGVAQCSWTRVTGVSETPTAIEVKVETLPCPIPGPGTSQLELRELTVSVTGSVGDRVVTDALGRPIPMRAVD